MRTNRSKAYTRYITNKKNSKVPTIFNIKYKITDLELQIRTCCFLFAVAGILQKAHILNFLCSIR